MSLKRRIRIFLERLINIHIYRRLPRGFDVVEDLTGFFSQLEFDIIFDVGANTGQSLAVYLARFSQASIYCFEPVAATFLKLTTRANNNPRVNCFRLAVGALNCDTKMVSQDCPTMSHLLDESLVEVPGNAFLENVTMVSLDSFCQTEGVDHISLLKVDTEGADLEVLKGACRMLKEQKIGFIEVEAGMNPDNVYHVPFEDLKHYLERFDYSLFGIYEQVNEWPTNRPHLRRSNPVFISRYMIDKYDQAKITAD